jgi:WD40 repeat protein
MRKIGESSQNLAGPNSNPELFTLLGHTDTITGVALSFEGSYLLSNSMDNTIRCFDVRPYIK